MQVSASIHAVKIPFLIPVAPGKSLDRFVYTYVVKGDDQTCLIDSGVAGAEVNIEDALAMLERKITDISLLLLTHAHPDHIGAAKALKEACDCQVMAHAQAKEWVEDIAKQYEERPVPGFHSLVGGSVQLDRLLGEGESIDLGNVSVRVLHTPGHSKCSISLFCPEQGVLFTGDAIPQNNDLPIYEDVAAAARSIRRLQQVENVKSLLASWSDPDSHADPYHAMENGLQYLQRIHATVRQVADGDYPPEPMELCRKMVAKLGLPEVAINPLIARSFSSHLPLLDQERI